VSRNSFSEESLWGTDGGNTEERLDPDSLLEGLTAPQREAVVQRGGPLLVIAAPARQDEGAHEAHRAHTGKGDARPWEIMAITFTNKAADEMRRASSTSSAPTPVTCGLDLPLRLPADVARPR